MSEDARTSPIRVAALAAALTAAACTNASGPPEMPARGTLTITVGFPSDTQRDASANAHAWVMRSATAPSCDALLEGDADPFEPLVQVVADAAVIGDELGTITAEVPEGEMVVYVEAVDFRGNTRLGGCGSVTMALPDSSVSISLRPVGVVDCAADGVVDGSRCDDGDLCTVGDRCTGGSCGGGSTRDCGFLDDACVSGACFAGVGCVPVPANEGGGCADDLACSTGETCAAGRCTGGDATACCPGVDCRELDCDDGVDDDGDGATDCGDFDCNLQPPCVSPEDQCANLFDDDGDGRTDCNDFDCAVLPICAGCAGACPDLDLGSAVGLDVVDSNTQNGCDREAPSCGATGANDLVYTWTAPSAGTFAFELSASSFAGVIEVLDGCGGASLGCGTAAAAPRVDVTLSSGQTVAIVVDSASSFTVDIREVVTSEVGLCDDDIDNDDDFMTDCDDVDDCSTDPACQEVCSGGADEDRDGRVDCEDLDCLGDSACGELEMCSGGSDDDGDGDVDCADSECSCECFSSSCPFSTLFTSSSSSTTSRCNRTVGSCIASTSVAPDYSYTYTTTLAGLYTFSVTSLTTGFDTAVYVRDATCGGTELACNTDGLSVDSSVSVTLAAAQTVIVFVDGVTDERGSFAIAVTTP